ncbi:accessory Sec system protein Asp2 [Periweissella fabalis]|uniref:Accessory Sec system protein Asp2 n=1 Tax=Periweissella fabalis TaxID=1070421 RepID=A0A7X6N0Y3_9LACO|nr:accessory Sec system protein Asp2 [Periweissella fabalis]MCM0599494.1 accessory Sec system protein Asp2 [Periweissella fabalis]NKZ23773.1 accessory Sec system protein Asp2 [Periweissella fabalis]
MEKEKQKVKVICLGDNEAEFSNFDQKKSVYFSTINLFDGMYSQEKLSAILKAWADDKMLRDVPIALGNIKQFKLEPELYKQLVRYTLIYNTNNDISDESQALFNLIAAVPVDFTDAIAIKETLNYVVFGRQNGFRLSPDDIEIAPQFTGVVQRKGRVLISVTSDFSQEKSTQVLSVKMNNYLPKNSYWDYLPEYDIEGDFAEDDIYFKIFLIQEGTMDVIDTHIITQKEINDSGYVFGTGERNVYLATSMYVKGGKGTINLGQIHVRQSHLSHGKMILGGDSINDNTQKVAGEILYYFNPGDFKPPLNVYFSGYRTLEGFEGQRMMHGMGSPFLLIADSRLEGGAFYMGNPDLENKVVELIKKASRSMGFKNDQIVMSGLSMGTFASLYYAPDIRPVAVIVGKPLVNIGDVALNERINRPEVFPTALDVLMNIMGEVSQASAEKLNKRFWTKFNRGVLKNTKFFISYMENDDYDEHAFPQLYEALKKRYPNVQIIHRGFIGRHNDDTSGIVASFFRHYNFILEHDFGRISKDEVN